MLKSMLVEARSVEFDMQKKRVPGDGVVTGYGTVNGRLYMFHARLYVIGGSLERCMLKDNQGYGYGS